MTGEIRHDALEACLEQMAGGQTLESVLRNYPGLVVDLRPTLEAADLLRGASSGETPQAAGLRSRTRVLNALVQGPHRGFLSRLSRMPRMVQGIVAGLLVIAIGTTSLAVASAGALPGDSLYPIKRVSETVRMQLTFGPRAKLTLVERHAMRRAEEVRQLLLLGRSASVTFEGVVQGQSETAWLVADIRVEVPGQVYRTAGIVPGMSVEVHGETLPEGIYLAEAIHLVGFQFSGPVLSLNSEEWTVGRYTFRIAADTWIEPGIQLGEVALVSVRLHDGGDLTGRAILRLTGAASPTSPTLSPEPPLPPSTAIPVDPTEESEEENNAPGGGDEEAPDPTPVDQGGGTPEDGGEEDEEDGGEEEEDEGEKIEIEGIVESQNTGYWVISGTTVFVDAQTEIKDNPQVGDSVKVDAIQFADGRIWAEKIEEDD